MEPYRLSNLVSANKNFRTSVNLSLNLTDREKVNSFIPTTSTVILLEEYLDSVLDKKEHSTLLIGPYGKGKSHLLLIFLALISWDHDDCENNRTIENLCKKINSVSAKGREVSKKIMDYWRKRKPFLPLIIVNNGGPIHQSFLIALKNALEQTGCNDIVPTTFHSYAADRINNWQNSYPDTYEKFLSILKEKNIAIDTMIVELQNNNDQYLSIFRDIYPKLTSGSQFTPLIDSDLIKNFSSVNYRLVHEKKFAGIYVIFDEFSKFIEAQNQDSTGNNMKLVQDFCELANNSTDEQLFITMVAHKAISEYNGFLSQSVVNSYLGIEGRIKERFFINTSQNNYELISSAIIKNKNIFKSFLDKSAYFSDEFNNELIHHNCFSRAFSHEQSLFKKLVLEGCFPLSPFSTYILLHLSEKIAQNERTLFTFVSQDAPHSLANYIAEKNTENSADDMIVYCDLVYDYFSAIFKKDLSNARIHDIWLNADYAISNASDDDQIKVLKSLGLILMINKNELLPTTKNLELCSGVKNIVRTLDELKNNNLIHYSDLFGSYSYTTAAGKVLSNILDQKRALINFDNLNIGGMYRKVVKHKFYLPRKYNTDNAITRYFRTVFMDCHTFCSADCVESLLLRYNSSDGLVIFIYSCEKGPSDFFAEIKDQIKNLDDSRIILVLGNSKSIMDLYKFDYYILESLLNDQKFINNNGILKPEINIKMSECIQAIEHEITKLYTNESVILHCSSKIVSEDRFENIDQLLDKAINNSFFSTPVINNEVINRSNLISSQTRSARLKIIKALLNHTDEPDFYAGNSQEATIYRSLFCVTKLNEQKESVNFKNFFYVIEKFLSNAVDHKQDISKLVDSLNAPPIGIRKSLIPVYLAYALRQRNSLPVIYNRDFEIDISSESLVSLCENPSEYKILVPREDALIERYLQYLENKFSDFKPLTNDFGKVKSIFTSIRRWFRSLPSVSRNLISVDKIITDTATRTLLTSFCRLFANNKENSYETIIVKLTGLNPSDVKDDFLYIDTVCQSLNSYREKILNQLVEDTNKVFGCESDKLTSKLKNWYETLSSSVKEITDNPQITKLLSFISELKIFDDSQVVEKIISIVCGVNVEDISSDSFISYIDDLKILKEKIESISDDDSNNLLSLSFVSKEGVTVTRKYSYSNELNEDYYSNVIEETIEDLSANEKIIVLLDALKKVIG